MGSISAIILALVFFIAFFVASARAQKKKLEQDENYNEQEAAALYAQMTKHKKPIVGIVSFALLIVLHLMHMQAYGEVFLGYKASFGFSSCFTLIVYIAILVFMLCDIRGTALTIVLGAYGIWRISGIPNTISTLLKHTRASDISFILQFAINALLPILWLMFLVLALATNPFVPKELQQKAQRLSKISLPLCGIISGAYFYSFLRNGWELSQFFSALKYLFRDSPWVRYTVVDSLMTLVLPFALFSLHSWLSSPRAYFNANDGSAGVNTPSDDNNWDNNIR